MTITTALRLASATTLALALAACGSPKDDSAAPAGASGAPATAAPATNLAATPDAAGAKPVAFGQCVACHSTVKGTNGIGPSLAGVYGAKAGEVTGYAFSDSLKASGLVFDDATLDKWLTNPAKLVPGTKMTYAGLADTAQRSAVIAYLKTLK